MIKDLPIPSPAETVLYDNNGNLTATVHSETVSEITTIPLLMAKSVTVNPTPYQEPEGVNTRKIVAKLHQPTAAVKCPQKQFRPKKVQRAAPPPHPKRKALSALLEIRKWKTKMDPLLPLTSFTALVREYMSKWGSNRITRMAILALRCGVEQYLVDTLQGANLLCMHKDHCTLQPKDICMTRRIRNKDDTMGMTEEAKEGIQKDFREYKHIRMSLVEAMRVETERNRKLPQIAKNCWEVQRRVANAKTPMRS